MGLDMFLFRAKRYPNPNIRVSGEDIEIISNYLYTKENKLPLSNKEKFELYPLDVVNFYKKEYDSEDNDYCCFKEIAYWRKANAIHRWFVDNVQNGTDDCHIHNECTQEILKELLTLLEKFGIVLFHTNCFLHRADSFLAIQNTKSGILIGLTRQLRCLKRF